MGFDTNIPAQVTAGPPQEGETAQGRYDSLSVYRQMYLMRGWDCSELTLPYLLPRNTVTAASELPVPWQSTGARCVNNLASKLLIALFPPNTPFFRLMVDTMAVDKAQAQLGDQQTTSLMSGIQSALKKYEDAVMTDIEMSGDRVVLFEALKHIIVTGNALLWVRKGGMRVYHMNYYVCRRDPHGNVLEIVTKEMVDPTCVPEEVRETVNRHQADPSGKTLDLYTWIKRTDTNWQVFQEVKGFRIPGTEATYPLDKCPWIALRFNRIDGEDYGRGYVEQCLGDLRSFDALTRAMIEGTAAAAKVLFLVKPNTSTQAKVLAESPNGAIRNGNAEDVTVLQLEKQADFAIAQQVGQNLKASLEYMFLMNSVVQRDAERVTATEVQYVAQELEQTLGGFYSQMSVELQLPYVTLKIAALQKSGKIPALPKGIVKPTIVTGMEAIGRGNDRDKLLQFLQDLAGTLGPQIMAQRINVSELISRMATADGIDTDGLVIPDEVVQAQMQAQAQAQALTNVGPNLVDGGAKLLQEGMKQYGAGQAPTGTQPNSPGG